MQTVTGPVTGAPCPPHPTSLCWLRGPRASNWVSAAALLLSAQFCRKQERLLGILPLRDRHVTVWKVPECSPRIPSVVFSQPFLFSALSAFPLLPHHTILTLGEVKSHQPFRAPPPKPALSLCPSGGCLTIFRAHGRSHEHLPTDAHLPSFQKGTPELHFPALPVPEFCPILDEYGRQGPPPGAQALLWLAMV